MRLRAMVWILIMTVAVLLVGIAGTALAADQATAAAWQVRTIPTPVSGVTPSFVSADGTLLAWTGAKSTGSRTYLFDLATGKNKLIPNTLAGDYYNPCLEGDLVAYQGHRTAGLDDIYLYDVHQNVVSQITFNTASGDSNDWNPRVDAGRVVWEKDMQGTAAKPGIYMYDTKTEQTTLLLAGDDYRDPDLSGDYLVCVKNVRNDGTTGPATEILLYNLATKEPPKSIADKTKSNEHPRIDGDNIVWTSGQPWSTGSPNPWRSYQVQLYSIAAGTTTVLTNDVAGNLAPDVKGNLVTWETKEPASIRLRDLAKEDNLTLPMPSADAHAAAAARFGVAWIGSKGLYTAVPPENATRFADVPAGYPYHDAIEGMADKKIIDGYTNGNFGPEDPVTRQQFAKMIVLTKGLTATLDDECSFTDSSSILHKDGQLYAYHYVARATMAGLIKGYANGSFRPLSNITRQQVITMLVRAGSTVLQPPSPSTWTGALSYSDPAHGENIRVAEYNGLLDGIQGPDGVLKGWNTTANATRGECAQLLWNLLKKLPAAPATAGDTPPTTDDTAGTTDDTTPAPAS